MNHNYWAKKPWKHVNPPTVQEHCSQVCQTAEAIYRAIGSELAAAIGADAATLAALEPLLRTAALLHDFAKVNSSFQAMLRARPGTTVRQPVRHEILAAWLLTDPDFFGCWFAELREETDVWPIIWAVAGHHLKMGDPSRGAILFNLGSETKTVEIPLATEEVRELLRHTARSLGVATELPKVGDGRFDTADEDGDGLEHRITRFAEMSSRAWARLRRKPEVVRRTALLKALLIAADVAGSALTADEKQPEQWVAEHLASRISPEALQSIVVKGTKEKRPHPFQEAVGSSAKRATIVIAGCGNGKTTAAYLWAQRHAKGRKLWFTYPTTGTASAGYQGYVYDHPDLLSALIHMRAQVDLQAILGNGQSDEDDEWVRLESLRAWGCQAIISTVDTALGLLQNQRRPLFSFPAIAAGAFVFDEVHSYDARLFGSLLRFLRTFPGLPVLLMSASIPPRRMEALREVLGDRTGEVIRGDPAMEGYRRYRLKPRASAEACRQEVTAALGLGKKILWVCNTVGDAIKEAQAARDWAGIASQKIIVYHGRFRYRDRVQRQKQVIDEFAYHTQVPLQGRRLKPGPVLVITTQVCEMSLDISADLMVTAECPLPSLVQRLGRLNRYATGDDPWPCLVYPFQGDPYNEKPELIQTRGDFRVGMAAARETVRQLTGQPCSQQDLSEHLDKMTDAEQFEEYSAWLDDGWMTEPAQLRDTDSGITLVREEDLEEIKRELGPEHAKPSKWTTANLVPWTIPMLYRRAFQAVTRVGGFPVAARGTVSYSESEGATWARNEQT
ncbi:MAG: CRISPR-associated helicase Cas3' [Verrucomicrobia bacterium]|nr:CRISPR-associated helicase Cas3' [Verrucomicrobiota bacterium]